MGMGVMGMGVMDTDIMNAVVMDRYSTDLVIRNGRSLFESEGFMYE